MYELLLNGILAVVVLLLVKLLRIDEWGGGRVAAPVMIPAQPGNDEPENAYKVDEILRRVYRDMNAQRMSGCGGWIPAAIEHGCGDPAVALTAVRWTLRDMYDRPAELDIPGLPNRFKFGVLLDAEAELKKIMGAGD